MFDEETGTVYEGYNKDLITLVHIVNRYTDIDVSNYDTPEGRYELYDILDSTGALERIHDIIDYDLDKVDEIYDAIVHGVKLTYERSHSLSHQIKQTLGSILGNEDIADTFAKALDVNAGLIDMMGAMKREKENKPSTELTLFAKRAD